MNGPNTFQYSAYTGQQQNNESGNKTLVYVGVNAKGKSILELTTVNDHGKLAVTPGMIGDRMLPYTWPSL